MSKWDHVNATYFRDSSQESEKEKKKVFISSSTLSTTDFAHPLWLSYALSCSRRRQMPSRPLQLAGLSLEPVYQQGYLTASAAPEASDSLSGWEGCQQSPWKEREGGKKPTMKSEGITAQSQEWQRCFRVTTLVTKINPIILWRKGMAWHLWWCLLRDCWHISGRAYGCEGTSGLICSKPLVKYMQLHHIPTLMSIFRWDLWENRCAAFGFVTALASNSSQQMQFSPLSTIKVSQCLHLNKYVNTPACA